MQDIDQLTYEYHHHEPTALIELKCGQPITDRELVKQLQTHQMRAHYNLAKRASLPLLLVYYTDDLRQFQVNACNELAKQQLNANQVLWDDHQYVEFLYRLRGLALPDDWPEWIRQGRLAAGLNN